VLKLKFNFFLNSDQCGGWVTKVQGLRFTKVKYKHKFRWNWDNIMHDLDGSLTGRPGDIAIFNDSFALANPACRPASDFKHASICTNTSTQIRFAFNNYQPQYATLLHVTNKHNQTVTVPMLKKRLTHIFGFMMVLEANQEYLIYYDNMFNSLTNMSYNGHFYNLAPNDFLIIHHPLKLKPDRVVINEVERKEFAALSPNINSNFDWRWNASISSVEYLVKNSLTNHAFQDMRISFNAFKCRYANCKAPENPALRAAVNKRSPNALLWSDPNTWLSEGFPKPNDNVTIPDGKYIVVDIPLPRFTSLIIEGVLEFNNSLDNRLEADFIFINGGQLIVGWEYEPMQFNVEIVMTGRKNGLQFMLPNGFEPIGSKTIGVYGGLDLHGVVRNVSWTRLAETAKTGGIDLVLQEAVDWKSGEEIIVTTTSFILEHTEIRRITGISADGKNLTLNETLRFDHLVSSKSGYYVAAGVGLLTRNVKIIGAEYDSQEADLYGFRILVSDYSAVRDDVLLYYKGFARISNVEMVHAGQFDRGSGDDAKYGIFMSNLGKFNFSRPTYVNSSSFHHGLGGAVGVLNSNDIPIYGNVIHRFVIEF